MAESDSNAQIIVGPAPFSFNLDCLKKGNLGISGVYGAFLAEAAAFCLFKNGHHSPVTLLLTGDKPVSASLDWVEVGVELNATWADLKEAVEYGAYGIAIVICVAAGNVQRVERSAQAGTGIDIWLSNNIDDHGIFQRSARLEVSGILKGDQNAITARLNTKSTQTVKSDETQLPAYIVIVEFGLPEARLKKRAGGQQQQ